MWSAGFAAAFATSLAVAASAGLSAQPGVFAAVSSIETSDSCRGSARRSVVSTVSPDRRELAVLFDGLSAVGTGAASASRVECRVSFEIEAPPATYGEFKGARYRYSIQGGPVSGEFQVRHGQRRLVMLMRWSLPASRRSPGEHADVIAHEGETLLTPCGGRTRIFLDVALLASSGSRTPTSVTLDSIEFDAGDSEQFTLAPCR